MIFFVHNREFLCVHLAFYLLSFLLIFPKSLHSALEKFLVTSIVNKKLFFG